MAVIRCRECRHFAAMISGDVKVIRTVKHSDEAEEGHDVVACSSCGMLHEIRRTDTGEAA